jgi:hypothetical protein
MKKVVRNLKSRIFMAHAQVSQTVRNQSLFSQPILRASWYSNMTEHIEFENKALDCKAQLLSRGFSITPYSLVAFMVFFTEIYLLGFNYPVE